MVDGGGRDLTGTVLAANIVNNEEDRGRIGDAWYDNCRQAA